MSHITQHLLPQAFFYWFEELSRIPHGSGKEQKLAAFLKAFADKRRIPWQEDALGNLYMRLPAADGYENEPSVLFQAHMDMIWAKEPELSFDFEAQPLRLAIRGDELHAQGTTLGADNAVGLATMLALADGEDPHPPLELLFTVEEETGMKGIRGFDMSLLRSRRMINMDCGDSHVLAVSSAGKLGAQIRREFPTQAVPHGSAFLRAAILGGTGGHSGLEIHRGRCCTGNAMGELLCALAGLDARLCTLEASGAILKSCTALLCLPAEQLAEAKARLEQAFAPIRQAHSQTDPALALELTQGGQSGAAVSSQATQAIAKVLRTLETKRYRADEADPEITVTSGAILSLDLEAGSFRLDYNIRSTQDEDKALLLESHNRAISGSGMALQPTDSYTGWPERQRSPFRQKFLAMHRALYGEDMALERVSGGIEVGIVMAAIPDMDAVGIAPTSRGAHTPQERLFISQVAPYWQLLTAVLAEKDTAE